MGRSITYSMNVDSRLNMEIGFVKNTFVAVDRTLYERFIYNGKIQHPFLVLQRLIKEELDANKIIDVAKPILTNNPREIGMSYEYEDLEDGVYLYQKIIVPSIESIFSDNLTEEEINERRVNKLYYLDENTIRFINDDNEEFDYNYSSDFDTIFDIVTSESIPDNCFSFDDKAFTLYSLMKCYLSLEKDRINSYIRNGCKGECLKEGCAYGKEDILLSAIIILKGLLEQNEIDEANILLERLHNDCSGLCKNLNNTKNGCGCK